jgi:hypothetical protein
MCKIGNISAAAYLPGVNLHGAFVGSSSLLRHSAVFGGSHPCTRAYLTIRRASAAGTIFPFRFVLI